MSIRIAVVGKDGKPTGEVFGGHGFGVGMEGPRLPGGMTAADVVKAVELYRRQLAKIPSLMVIKSEIRHANPPPTEPPRRPHRTIALRLCLPLENE